MRGNAHGVAMGLVLVSALVFAIAAFGAMTMAMSRLQQEQFLGEDRMRASYAAEAGLVWAMQRLWESPTECFGASPDFSIDTDGSGPLPPMGVDITATPCPGPGVINSKLSAKVVYTP